MTTCVLLVLRLQGISGDQIQRLVTLGVIPKAHWKIPTKGHRGLKTVFESLKKRNSNLRTFGLGMSKIDIAEYMGVNIIIHSIFVYV